MFSTIRNIVGRWTISENSPNEVVEVVINGFKIRVIPGLSCKSEELVKLGRKVGWIISFDQLIGEIDSGNLFIDYKLNSEMTQALDVFSSGLLKYYQKRENTEIDMSLSERKGTANEVFNLLIENQDEKFKNMCAEGFLIARYSKEVKTRQKSEVDQILEKFLKFGSVPPMIVTPLAMEWLLRLPEFKSNLQADQSAIDFEPIFVRKSSTRLDLTLEESILEIDDQISAIDADHDVLDSQCQTFLEKSIYDLTDAEEYPAIVAELGDQSRQQKLMITNIHRQQKKIMQMKSDYSIKLVRQNIENDYLKEQLNDKTMLLDQKNNQIDDMESSKRNELNDLMDQEDKLTSEQEQLKR